MIAVQPTSCSTLIAAKKRAPYRPKLTLVVSIELSRSFPPITPAANIMVQPITCPIRMARSPFAKPSGAKYVPVRISAMDTAAPNQMSAERPAERAAFLFSLMLSPRFPEMQLSFPLPHPPHSP